MTCWTDPDAVLRALRGRPAFAAPGLVGSPGYTLPAFRAPLEIDPAAPGAAALLLERGIELHGPPGEGNRIVVEEAVTGLDLKLYLNRRRDTLLLIPGQRQVLRGIIRVEGDGNAIALGEAGETSCQVTAVLRSTAAGLFIGKGTTSGGIQCWLEGRETSLHIGDDCLLSWGIWFRLADSHAMIDLRSRAMVNPPRSIRVEPHVWIGQDAILMPGAEVGAGSIIGARSIVTRPVPRAVVAVGAPARPVRREVSWTRSSAPRPSQIDAIYDMPLMPALDEVA
ncbi:acyltransferase [Paracraurococcus lichenis]|uniref:Acyltransferase n=1 Tax=Paracraurococcus lichenis TaxID=3064888 RepID=A0ABT9DVC9_9PROT|nr:acyltransferase [Paracraurococcus sp. LOR1-02]MDO9707857.1 acyltransferase [Paracraurococcus sp. LOR1-02]